MGTLWNGKGKDFSDVSFLNGTSTEHDYSGNNVLDPNWPDDGSEPPEPPPTNNSPDPVDKSTDPINPRDKDKQPPVDKTLPTPPDDGGGDGVVDETLPPTESGVPDYDPQDFSGEAGAGGAGIDDLEYNVPEAGDVDFVTSSGTADPTMTPWEVTEEQTVMGQLTKNYDRDSPYFETARQRAIRQAMASGGQNSAMAGGFGELAAMDTAFKASFQDAQTYARSAEFNAAMANQFSLAEQRFVHNALLSDQSYRQARELQTQRIAGQMEAIILDYKGRSALMDQELQNWFTQAKQAHEYQIDLLYEQGAIAEGQAGRDFARTMVLNGMNTMTNFYTNAFASVMQYANNPNFTPAQQKGAMENGMAWAQSQWEMLQRYWGQWAAGGPPMPSFTGQSNGWYDFSQPYTGSSTTRPVGQDGSSSMSPSAQAAFGSQFPLGSGMNNP